MISRVALPKGQDTDVTVPDNAVSALLRSTNLDGVSDHGLTVDNLGDYIYIVDSE